MFIVLSPISLVLSPISLAFGARIVHRQEPILVDALGADLAVEGFHEGIVLWLAQPREVERYAIAPRPSIEIPGDKLGPIVDAKTVIAKARWAAHVSDRLTAPPLVIQGSFFRTIWFFPLSHLWASRGRRSSNYTT